MSNMFPEFYYDGTFDPTEQWPRNEQTLHQAGLDQIDPAYDHIDTLSGAIGFDPSDLDETSLQTRQDIERKNLPQWGPPFVQFVDERITGLEKKVQEAIQQWSFQTRTDFFVGSMNPDVSGTIDPAKTPNAYLYETPPGFTFALHRFTVLADSFSFAVPASAAGSYYEIRVNGEAIDGGSLVSPNGIPFVRTWGTRDAPRIRDGEILSLFVFQSGASGHRVTVKGQGSLDRTIEG